MSIKSEGKNVVAAAVSNFNSDCFILAVLMSKKFTTELSFTPSLKAATTLPNETVNELFVDTALAG